ncbi:UNVERIFIED_CONTAM: hypothetical protein Sradi_3157600 [Sesamum radiatum]|uniref:Uncharacterized protein n=1 Tax=Sesamum radiatum TaxID=300843 RepID=A0AAW2RG70_SESRA
MFEVGKFIIPVDFIVLDMEEDVNMPLIIGRLFLATSTALIDVQKGQLTLRVNDEHVVFNVFKPMKYLHKNEHDIFVIDSINTPRTSNANLAKCKALKENSIEKSNENNLQDMKEEHKEVANFVDAGHEPNTKKRWRNQAYENGELYKEHTKARDEFHIKNKKFKDGDKRLIKTRALLKWIGRGSSTTLREHFYLLWSTPSYFHILEGSIVKLTTPAAQTPHSPASDDRPSSTAAAPSRATLLCSAVVLPSTSTPLNFFHCATVAIVSPTPCTCSRATFWRSASHHRYSTSPPASRLESTATALPLISLRHHCSTLWSHRSFLIAALLKKTTVTLPPAPHTQGSFLLLCFHYGPWRIRH